VPPAEPQTLRIALAQTNPVVGDLAANEAAILGRIEEARDAGAQLVVFSELTVTGYPPEDLLLKRHFLADARASVDRIAAQTSGIVAIVGFPELAEDVYNSAALIADGAIAGIYRKVFLPNYGVFDEQRYFQGGRRGAVADIGGVKVGITICEDVWEPGPPLTDEALAGAALIVNLSASPYHAGKGAQRERMFVQRARDAVCAVALCNTVGGQDELVFDGHSLVVDEHGEILARAPQFEEALLIADIDVARPLAARLRDARHRPAARAAEAAVDVIGPVALPAERADGVKPAAMSGAGLPDPLEFEAEVYGALVLGLRDYVRKNGFGRVVLGLSGGIDSALVACVAVDALGPEAVTAVVMPSPYSSSDTQDDARRLADNLGVERIELPIAAAMEAYERTLAETFEGRPADLTEENIQARIRGNFLMALSNKFGWLVLTTGNKSEMSVGYSTLYGDSAGGFAVIKDCPKTLVYRLAEHRNAAAGRDLIPSSIIERAPSAELRPDQRDEDSLPPYEVLDRILEGYVEQDLGRDALTAQGLPADAVERVIALVDGAEYKRRQAPPGVKITPRAFGRDRRMPITNRYRG
jgi:NAD+ synthase (glutamine-hydrolysing)